MKRILTTTIAIFCVASTFAGGLVTNTNRTTGFLRNPAKGISFNPEAVYFNPAGTVFMENGWHIDFSLQQAYQTRNVTTTFAPLAQNINNYGEDTKDYTGYTFAPFIPSIHAAWKKDRWAVMASFGVSAGGGSIIYNRGLASFESAFSVLPNVLTAAGLPTTMYGADDMHLNATTLTGTLSVGGAFKIIPCLSVSLQLNMNYSYADYEGSLRGLAINPMHPILNPTGEMIYAYDFFNSIGMPSYAELVSDKELDANQGGFSVNPVIALCFHKNGWTANARYEFMSSMYLTNSTRKDIVLEGIGMFPDGEKVSNDMPAKLTLAAGYDFGKVRVSGEWHHYLDKSASNSSTVYVAGNTNEFAAGVEWDVSKTVLLSCGVQRTLYNLDIDYFWDRNYNLSATSVGFGGGVRVCKFLRLEGGLFLSFFDSKTREEAIYRGNILGLPGSDKFERTNMTWGIGAVFNF